MFSSVGSRAGEWEPFQRLLRWMLVSLCHQSHRISSGTIPCSWELTSCCEDVIPFWAWQDWLLQEWELSEENLVKSRESENMSSHHLKPRLPRCASGVIFDFMSVAIHLSSFLSIKPGGKTKQKKKIIVLSKLLSVTKPTYWWRNPALAVDFLLPFCRKLHRFHAHLSFPWIALSWHLSQAVRAREHGKKGPFQLCTVSSCAESGATPAV